jgi:hypothetical protein
MKPAPATQPAAKHARHAVAAISFARETVGDGPGREALQRAITHAQAGNFAAASIECATARDVSTLPQRRSPGGASLGNEITDAMGALWIAQTDDAR